MSYTLRAFIGKSVTLRQQVTQIAEVHVIALPHEFALIPLTETLTQLFEPDERIEPFWFLTTKLAALAAEISLSGPIGYIEIDLWAGQGDRSALLWCNQQVIFGPTVSTNTRSTEELFRLLGVPETKTHDCFDTLGLGRHRHTEDWLDI